MFTLQVHFTVLLLDFLFAPLNFKVNVHCAPGKKKKKKKLVWSPEAFK